MQSYEAIIVGAGHNGLVTAAYLAKAGKKVLVLERRAIVGGIAVTEEIYPGFKFPTAAHLCGSFSRRIIEDLQLEKHGLETSPLTPLVFAPLPDGGSLLIPRAPAKRAEEIRRFSNTDAAKLASFTALTKRLLDALSLLLRAPMPDGAIAGGGDFASLLKVGWRLHRLGREHLPEFLRILPMSIADLVNEWFETESLKAVIATTGLLGGFVGPRAQGTSYVYLHHLLDEPDGPFRSPGLVRGGIGNLTQALARAATRYGAEISTDAEVQLITTRDGIATGVALANGDEISANLIISNVDVKRTFSRLVEPTYLDPHFLLQVRNIRARGTVAKIHLALDALPKFKSAAHHSSGENLAGVIHIGPTLDYLERAADDAKYGRFSKAPFLEITIPSVADPSLAPAGKHVMSVWMQYAPYQLREGNWNDQREQLGDVVANLIDDYAPGFRNSILHRQVLTPLDLENTFGLTQGHLYHAELALDQIFFMRPVPGWARYRTPIENLYLCGSASHPGGGVNGLPGLYAAKEILKGWRQRK